MSKETFEFNAPQFVDFNAAAMDDSDDADTFFDVEYEESPNRVENKENEPEISTLLIKDKSMKDVKTVSKSHVIKEEILSPNEENLNSFKERGVKKGLRRLSADRTVILASGLPVSAISGNLCQKLDKLSVNAKRRTQFEGIPITIKEEKPHTMTTRNDTAGKTPIMELRSRAVIKEGGDRKRKSASRASEWPSKCMALAEHILNFHKDTPPRFHSSRGRSSGNRRGLLKARMSYKPQKTVPMTPKLSTALRSRPSYIPTREEMELEEMKKHQIKAMPLNEKALQPPKPQQKSGKPPTTQEPFNLTQVFKKPAPKAEPFVFTANPVPRGLLEKTLGVAPKKELPLTVPQSPAITRSTRNYKAPIRVPAFTNDNDTVLEDVYGFGVPFSKVTRPKNTEVKPFSFEERDREMLERKEKKKQEILAAEKKAREFKANPLPAFVLSKNNNSSRCSHIDSSKMSTTSSLGENPRQPFKARSPKVLRKNPFKPVLEHSHSQPAELTLYTERRITERRQFEVQQMMREEKLAYDKEQLALEQKNKEEEKVARLRQEAVHKAQPMPNFKSPPNFPLSTHPLTEPKSPKFSKRTRRT